MSVTLTNILSSFFVKTLFPCHHFLSTYSPVASCSPYAEPKSTMVCKVTYDNPILGLTSSPASCPLLSFLPDSTAPWLFLKCSNDSSTFPVLPCVRTVFSLGTHKAFSFISFRFLIKCGLINEDAPDPSI